MTTTAFRGLFNHWNLDKHFIPSTTATDITTCQNECDLSTSCNGYLFSKENNKCYMYLKKNKLKNAIHSSQKQKQKEKNFLFYKQKEDYQKKQIDDYFKHITKYNPNLQKQPEDTNKYIQLENNWNLTKYFMKSTPSTFISCQQMCNTSNECNGFVYTKDNKCFINNSTTTKDITTMIEPNSHLNTYFFKYINENQKKQSNDYFQFLQNKINETMNYLFVQKNKPNNNEINDNNSFLSSSLSSWNEKYNLQYQLYEEKMANLKDQFSINYLLNDSSDVVYSNYNQYLLYFSLAIILLFLILVSFLNSNITQKGILSVTFFGTLMLFLSFYIPG